MVFDCEGCPFSKLARKWLRSEEVLLNLLKDGKEHRFTELRKKSKINPSTLSRHLKVLAREGIVKKRVDFRSGVSPYPSYYKLKTSN